MIEESWLTVAGTAAGLEISGPGAEAGIADLPPTLDFLAGAEPLPVHDQV